MKILRLLMFITNIILFVFGVIVNIHLFSAPQTEVSKTEALSGFVILIYVALNAVSLVEEDRSKTDNVKSSNDEND